jgi:hypothetical protein
MSNKIKGLIAAFVIGCSICLFSCKKTQSATPVKTVLPASASCMINNQLWTATDIRASVSNVANAQNTFIIDFGNTGKTIAPYFNGYLRRRDDIIFNQSRSLSYLPFKDESYTYDQTFSPFESAFIANGDTSEIVSTHITEFGTESNSKYTMTLTIQKVDGNVISGSFSGTLSSDFNITNGVFTNVSVLVNY